MNISFGPTTSNKKVKDWLPEYFASIKGMSVDLYLENIKETEVESKEDAIKLVNKIIDVISIWADSFKI